MLKQFSEYNNWANSLLLEALLANVNTLPESCINLFSHIVNAQMIWVCRINGTTPQIGVWQANDLRICKMILKESTETLLQLKCPEGNDSRIVKYTNTIGDYFETSVADILLHVFNHGTYHRAQIAKEMKLHHIDPVNTDYIQFVRLKSK